MSKSKVDPSPREKAIVRKRKTDALTGAVLIVFALAMIFRVIPAQIQESSETSSIAPSFVANLSMVLLALFSVLLIIKTRFWEVSDSASVLTKSNVRWFAFVVISLVASGLLINYLGFLAGGVLMVSGYMVSMGERRTSVIVTTACIAAGICYLFLTYALKLG